MAFDSENEIDFSSFCEELRLFRSEFSETSSTSDIALEVEGHTLHVNKSILSEASPVFARMFKWQFKEKESSVIPLPEKNHDDVVEMLLCIYPSHLKAIERSNVERLLELADEYEIKALTERCERFLLSQCELMVLQHVISIEEIVTFLYFADKFNLCDLLERTTDMAARKPYGFNCMIPNSNIDVITGQTYFLKISDKALLKVTTKRLSWIEQHAQFHRIR